MVRPDGGMGCRCGRISIVWLEICTVIVKRYGNEYELYTRTFADCAQAGRVDVVYPREPSTGSVAT